MFSIRHFNFSKTRRPNCSFHSPGRVGRDKVPESVLKMSRLWDIFNPTSNTGTVLFKKRNSLLIVQFSLFVSNTSIYVGLNECAPCATFIQSRPTTGDWCLFICRLIHFARMGTEGSFPSILTYLSSVIPIRGRRIFIIKTLICYRILLSH